MTLFQFLINTWQQLIFIHVHTVHLPLKHYIAQLRFYINSTHIFIVGFVPVSILSHPSLNVLPGDFVHLSAGLKPGLADLKSIFQLKSFHDSVILLPPSTQTTGRLQTQHWCRLCSEKFTGTDFTHWSLNGQSKPTLLQQEGAVQGSVQRSHFSSGRISWCLGDVCLHIPC